MIDDYRCNKHKSSGGGVYFLVKSWRGCGCGHILTTGLSITGLHFSGVVHFWIKLVLKTGTFAVKKLSPCDQNDGYYNLPNNRLWWVRDSERTEVHIRQNWPKYSPLHESYLRNNLTLNGSSLLVGNWGSNNKWFQYTSADVGHTRSSTSGTILW